MVADPPAQPGANQDGDELFDQHRRLMQTAAEIGTQIGSKPDLGGAWLRGLIEKLGRFEADLRQHFAWEEQSGLFTGGVAEFPHLAPRVQKMFADHPKLLAAFGQVIERAEALEKPGSAELQELCNHVDDALRALRRHEAAENELVVGAYSQDHGGGD